MSQLFAWGTPKYWSFSFSISPSSENPGLISFRMDWLDLLAVQGTLKSLLQHHSSKASVFRCSAFLIVQLSHPYMTTGSNYQICNTILLIIVAMLCAHCTILSAPYHHDVLRAHFYLLCSSHLCFFNSKALKVHMYNSYQKKEAMSSEGFGHCTLPLLPSLFVYLALFLLPGKFKDIKSFPHEHF